MSALAAELTFIGLGDQRLNRRAQHMLEKLGEKPTLSIPAACGGWAKRVPPTACSTIAR